MKYFLIVLVLTQYVFSQKIMFVPMDTNYSIPKQSSIASDLFDEFNGVVVDINIDKKNNNDDNNSLKVTETLLPIEKHQDTISKFYLKYKKNGAKYIHKIASYYHIDTLVFMNLKKIKKKKNFFKVSYFVYKNNNISKGAIELKFNNSTDSFSDKSLKKLKKNLIKLLK